MTSTPPARPAPGPPAPQRTVDGTLTVMAGDTLWEITAQYLGQGASDAEVSAHLDSWHEHNRLSSHGDLIHPGDRLTVPQTLLDRAAAQH